jgi:hypothetical protein
VTDAGANAFPWGASVALVHALACCPCCALSPFPSSVLMWTGRAAMRHGSTCPYFALHNKNSCMCASLGPVCARQLDSS